MKRGIDLCQGKMCGWEQKAFLFLSKPNVKYSPRPITDIASASQLQNHIVNYISILRQDMFLGHNTLYDNWNVYKNKIDTLLNYNIAIGSFIMAFIGLLISLFSIYYKK
jgi:hypothetical protein